MLDTDQPIANASIQIVEEISKQVVRSESSGPDGRFSVRVRSGTFILRVHAKGFSALEATVKVTPEARRNIGRVELRPGV